MSQYDREELQSILEKAVTTAQGFEQDSVDGNRVAAQKAYLGYPRGDELPGRSAQISMDVSDMVQALKAQLTPMLSSDVFVTFEANGAEDEEQVEAETRAVNKIIMEDEQGYIKIMMGIQDALLQRNGVIKVWMEEQEEVETLEFTDLTDEEKAFLLQDTEPNQTAEDLGTKKGVWRMRLTTTTRTPRLEGVNPRHFLYTRHWDEYDLQRIPFVAERKYLQRHELVSMGFSKQEVDELPTDPPYWYPIRRDVEDYQEMFAREVDYIEVYCCYILLDMDGTGETQRYKAHYCNRKLLGEFEPVPWVPFAVGSGILYPHEMMGESLYDKLKDVQETKTSALRQWLDNLRNGNNARTAVDVNAVNLEDTTNTRPGGIIRVKGAPGDAIAPMPINDVGPSAQALMDYYDKIRTERGGAALDMMQAEAQIVGDTAHGVERQFSSKELTVQMIGKSLAETLIRQVFLLMHQTLRVYSNEPLQIKFAGQWTEVDPSQWPARSHVNVIVGQTAGQRNAAQQALMMFIQQSFQLLASPMAGQLVDMSGIYKALQDWLQMAGVDNPTQYLIDPSSPQAQQAAQQAAQQQQQMQAMQMQLHQQQVELDKYKHDTELQYKYFDSALDADVKEGETLSKVQVEAAKLASGNVNAERDREEGAKDRASSNGKVN